MSTSAPGLHPSDDILPPPLPLNRASIRRAHATIKPHIHRTPILTSTYLDNLASFPGQRRNQNQKGFTVDESKPWSALNLSLFFKCENFQRIGAFKIRGALHAVSRLTPAQKAKGVVTHSSGNHAQALALAASTHGTKAHVIMPRNSTPSKIEATKGYGAEVYFSGTTHEEREEVLGQVIKEKGGGLTVVPPYDHPDIILGQGTMGLEMEEQVGEIVERRRRGRGGFEEGWGNGRGQGANEDDDEDGVADVEVRKRGSRELSNTRPPLDAVIAPIGGGGMLSGIATWFGGKDDDEGEAPESDDIPVKKEESSKVTNEDLSLNGVNGANGVNEITISPKRGYHESQVEAIRPKKRRRVIDPLRKQTLVYAAEPSDTGADDFREARDTARRKYIPTERITHVETTTIADGLRTPVGVLPFDILIYDPFTAVSGAYSVTDNQIRAAMKLVYERLKIVVEPSCVVGLAVVLWDTEWRHAVAKKQQVERECGELGEGESWHIGIVLSGGNVDLKMLGDLVGG